MRLLTLTGLSLALLSPVLASDHASFSPQDMLSAPRPQPAIASPDGRQAISVVDRWDPKDDKITRTVYLLSLNTTHPKEPIEILSAQPGHAGEFFWLDDGNIAYLNGTTLWTWNLAGEDAAVDESAVKGHAEKPKPALTFPAGVNPTNLLFERESGALVFSGQVWEDGDFEETGRGDKAWEGRGTTGMVYDELFIRHWDTWRTPGKVWTIGATHLDASTNFTSTAKPTFINLLNSTSLVSPMDPHGSVALSHGHVAFTVKPPHQNPALHTREDVYVTALPEAGDYTAVEPMQLTPKDHGAISSLRFSPDGRKLAWLQMEEDGYESDKRVVVVYTVSKEHGLLGETERWTDEWDRSPTAIEWALDSASLYLIAEHHGRVLPYHLTHAGHLPTPLLFDHATTSLTPLRDSTLLISRASLLSPMNEYILDLSSNTTAGDEDKLPSRHLHQLTDYSAHVFKSLEKVTIEELWTPGAEEWPVHSWVLLPPGWKNDSRAEYPLAFFVHGGPQGAWEDTWSTRWNPALFAAQGYVVVAVNPTGSTGYGQEFCDKIKENWGGAPFKDLLASYHAALDAYPQIDPERTNMLGGSYGGYMANWIQGHNDQFGFKSIVCHDGIFDTTTAFYETEEVWFPTREFGGNPTQVRATYEKWNPMNHVAEWKTPELIIHGGKDYRLVDGEGFAAFTALQVQGVPSRLLYFPDENHWVLKPSNSMKWHREVLKWMEEWTGEKDVDAAVKSGNDRSGLVIQA